MATVFEPLGGVIDTALVGHRNSAWLAPLALGATLMSTFTWMLNFLIHASTQSLAHTRYSESGRVETLRTALLFSLTVGLVTGSALWMLRDWAYQLLAVSSDLAPMVDAYLLARIIGHPVALLALTALSLLRGLRLLKLTLVLVITGSILNGILSFIALWWLDLGLFGLGLATVLSQGCVLGLALIFILRHLQLTPRALIGRVKRESLLVFGEKSWHVFGRSVGLASCFFLATRVASTTGALNLAAHQVAMQFWLLAAYLVDGLALSATILLAERLAVHDGPGVRRMLAQLMNLTLATSLIFTTIYLVFSEQLWSLFTPDREIHAVLSELWPLIAWGQLILCPAYLYDGVLFGAGQFARAKYLMLASILLGFLPGLVLAHRFDSLWWLWAGLTMLGLLRFFVGSVFTYRIYQDGQNL
jgi:multidrug resistance protein, MATE family